MTAVTLKERFESCIKCIEGYESIDWLLRGEDLRGKKRADYLFFDRKLILEQKSLNSDRTSTFLRFANETITKREILIFGTVPFQRVLNGLPDGKELQRRLLLELTRAVETTVRQSDKQTAQSREIFSIPDATGLLVILNEHAKLMSPDTIHYRLKQMLVKTDTEGILRYPHNQGALLVSGGPGTRTTISLVVRSPGENQLLAKFALLLSQVWFGWSPVTSNGRRANR